MKKLVITLLLVFMMTLSLVGCGETNSKPNNENKGSYEESKDEEDGSTTEDEVVLHNRDAEVSLGNNKTICVVEYDSNEICYEANWDYGYLAPVAYLSHNTYGVAQVYFGNDLSENEPATIEDVYKEHTGFLYEYRSNVEVSSLIEYVSDSGYKYVYFTTSSTWHETEYETTYICVQLTDSNMMALIFDEVLEIDSLADFVNTSFYIREVSDGAASDVQQEVGYLAVEWYGADTDTGKEYDLDVLLEGTTVDGSSITADANGENYYDAYGNLVAIKEKSKGLILLKLYDTNVYYVVTVENSFPVNGWTSNCIITYHLPTEEVYNGAEYCYRGATGFWYYTFAIDNGMLTSVY